jgi:hypothetical protein
MEEQCKCKSVSEPQCNSTYDLIKNLISSLENGKLGRLKFKATFVIEPPDVEKEKPDADPASQDDG